MITVNLSHLYYFVAGLLIGIILLRLWLRKHAEKSENAWLKLFSTNKDLDSTLKLVLRGIITIAVLIMVVMFFSMFHDDLDKSDLGMLASQMIGMGALVLQGIMQDTPKHNNGQTPHQ